MGDTKFDLKAEIKKIKADAENIQDPAARKKHIEYATARMQEHATMLRNMEKFVTSKSKNGKK